MRLGIVLAILGLMCSVATVDGMSEEDWQFFQAQKTYCQLKVGKRYYRQERLDEFCIIKVRLFEDQVSF
jgi:predicted ATPase